MSAIHIILVGGPTASGKSAFAMQLARAQNGSIINADAMQVYSGLPVLTAQPDPADMSEIPHLLYQIMDSGEAGSAGKWLALAKNAITEVKASGRLPILVGGTGMYFSALLGGLADIPEIPKDVRDAGEKLFLDMGEQKFRRLLAAQDMESAARIKSNDRQRLIRAYEVAVHTGKSLSQWQKDGIFKTTGDYAPEFHLLSPPREALYRNCDARFIAMVERGAIDEVKNLLARNLSPALPAMKILGVGEIAMFLKGEISRGLAIEKAQQMTRNYAKRQMTWFRNQWKKKA
jgi:tRNA dimethylallyltransferase